MPMQEKHNMGFDEFDDEDDDIDSCELDNQNNNQKQEPPSLARVVTGAFEHLLFNFGHVCPIS